MFNHLFLKYFICLREVTFRKGAAKHWDHAQLVHRQWLQVARLGLNVWVCRVATDDNISDLPSRLVCAFVTIRILFCRFVTLGACSGFRNAEADGRHGIAACVA